MPAYMGCLISSLAAKFAFFPPSPATYTVKKLDNGRHVAIPSSTSEALGDDDNSLDVRVLETKGGNKIVAFYFKNPLARLTILYSHGNAADLAQLHDLFLQIKVNLRVNLMGYDYSGYGASSGKPSESNTYADIEAVFECLETEYGVNQEDIILYGQSVGSGPTLHLAARLPRLRGVVLHSAILSGLRVVCHMKCTLCFDMYKNVNKIRKVKCPVLVIHGTDDDVVSCRHGNKLWKLSREPYDPLWIKGGGHCNLEIYPDFVRHLSSFVTDMENMNTAIRLKSIRKSLRLPIRSNMKSSNKCCNFNLCGCSRPKCLKCCKCSRTGSCLSCCSWRPKCPDCLKPECPDCLKPECPDCLKPECPDCLKPECPDCVKPKCSTCVKQLRWPKCKCLCCCWCFCESCREDEA